MHLKIFFRLLKIPHDILKVIIEYLIKDLCLLYVVAFWNSVYILKKGKFILKIQNIKLPILSFAFIHSPGVIVSVNDKILSVC